MNGQRTTFPPDDPCGMPLERYQTSLMLQVADYDPIDAASFTGLRIAGGRPALLRSLKPRDRGNVGPQTGGPVPVSVKPIGPFVEECGTKPAVLELVAFLLRQRPQERLTAYLDDHLNRGLPVEQIYLRLLQPAARHLGEMWDEDNCSFVDVTLAMSLLQSALRSLAPAFQRSGRSEDGTRSVLLASLSGDQHTFGLTMAAEFFRRSGWSVCSVLSGNPDELVCRLQNERNVVVGFSASRPDQLPALSATIRHLRRMSGGRIAGILVGGPLVFTHTESALATGADAVALDARQALAEAELLSADAGDCW